MNFVVLIHLSWVLAAPLNQFEDLEMAEILLSFVQGVNELFELSNAPGPEEIAPIRCHVSCKYKISSIAFIGLR